MQYFSFLTMKDYYSYSVRAFSNTFHFTFSFGKSSVSPSVQWSGVDSTRAMVLVTGFIFINI